MTKYRRMGEPHSTVFSYYAQNIEIYFSKFTIYALQNRNKFDNDEIKVKPWGVIRIDSSKIGSAAMV